MNSASLRHIIASRCSQVFDMNTSPFGSKVMIPPNAKVVFVADMFVEDYVGGAELTTEALIASSPLEVFKLRSKDVSIELLRQGVDRFWVFGNFANLNPQLIPSIVGNLKYSVVEYDYKFCRARSPEKHLAETGQPCDCADGVTGKMVSAFYYGSMGMWWMSEKQKQVYLKTFPFLSEKDNVVLSSVFDKQTLGRIKQLRAANTGRERNKLWVVLGSNSWIKGAEDAVQWCVNHGHSADVVWNLPYDDLLQKLAASDGFVYLPKGGDTCPRMVIEAKLLGCQLHLNESVQHKDEEWFATDDLESIEEYLFAAPGLFWNGIKEMMSYKPSISGYTTTYNAVKQLYPFEQCIASMLQFCDEVCVVDGGSTDGTWERLEQLAFDNMNVARNGDVDLGKLKIKQVKRDWSSKRHPVFDGMQKAEARAMCTKDFCWQMDSDEIVHEDDAPRILELARNMPKGADIVALPVIEYWGGPEKVRLDVQPWKWRLSRNSPDITHGIPVELRQEDADGVYAMPGTDGCDMVSKATGSRIPFISFYTPEVDRARQAAMAGNEDARQQYEQWFNAATNQLPGVFHYSWFDLPRKIKLYRDYWQNHWSALWNRDTSDTAENNMMFGVPWSQVTDEMIVQKAQEMKDKLGGWIWHHPWDGKVTTPHIVTNRTQPKVMQ